VIHSTRKHIFDNPKNTKRVLLVLYILCGLLLGLDLIHHRHVIHAWEGLLGFYGIYGFVACIVLVLVAKQMRKWLMRRDNYYDAD